MLPIIKIIAITTAKIPKSKIPVCHISKPTDTKCTNTLSFGDSSDTSSQKLMATMRNMPNKNQVAMGW
jgi:hypothetical protein